MKKNLDKQNLRVSLDLPLHLVRLALQRTEKLGTNLDKFIANALAAFLLGEEDEKK